MAATPLTFGLADGAHLDGAGGARHGAGLDEHGGQDVVAGVDVGQQLIEQVAPVGPVPQMVVRVDDGQVGLQDRLRAPVEPSLADGQVVRGRAWAGGGRGRHG
jgi:hypothetical protein